MKEYKNTKAAYMWSTLLNAPFWALYGLLSFILYKDLKATALQLSLFIALKPLVSLFSVYWSAFVSKRSDRLAKNVMWATVIGKLPFFFFPLFDNVWYIIGSSAIYMMMNRGVIPAWMELLKLYLPETKREHLFSTAQTISYLLGMLLPFGLGFWMDSIPGFWHILFPVAAGIGLLGVFFEMRLPKGNSQVLPVSKKLLSPWKSAWQILKENPSFARFQVGFVLGGGGLMLMQPALPVFFVQELNLSYTELALALSACKGIGFALTSRFWAKAIQKVSPFLLLTWVTALALLFPLALLLGPVWLSFVYVAYLIYGAMQAGSEIGWHLSGPIFSKEEDSSRFSSVNVLMVGLRGCIAPFLGGYLLAPLSSKGVLAAGGVMCALASLFMAIQSRKEAVAKS